MARSGGRQFEICRVEGLTLCACGDILRGE
jgi:hypothetical protein